MKPQDPKARSREALRQAVSPYVNLRVDVATHALVRE